jgi:hypothetical protein
MLLNHDVNSYYIYVDDILVIYENIKTNIINIIDDSNINKNVKFRVEQEINNGTNFLDTLINTEHTNLIYKICRKSSLRHNRI